MEVWVWRGLGGLLASDALIIDQLGGRRQTCALETPVGGESLGGSLKSVDFAPFWCPTSTQTSPISILARPK